LNRFLSWSRTRLPLSLFILTLLAGLGEGARLASAEQPPAAPPNPGAAAVKPGPPPDLAVFFAGEVMGWTEPCG
jgi:hypothetical protein